MLPVPVGTMLVLVHAVVVVALLHAALRPS
jgi:hypothetical protein